MAAVTDAQNASSIASNRLRSARSFASWYDDVSLTFRPLGKGAPSATFYFAVAYRIPTVLAKLDALVFGEDSNALTLHKIQIS